MQQEQANSPLYAIPGETFGWVQEAELGIPITILFSS